MENKGKIYAAHKNAFIFSCFFAWLIYVSAYLGRINLSITIPYLQNEQGFTKAALGILASGFFCTYAAGQLVNGVLGDRIQVRYFISLGLLVSGLCNILFCIFPVFPLMFIAWSLNGYFQSMLWGPLLRTVTEHVPKKNLNWGMGLMSTSPIIGHFLAYVVTGRLAVFWRWEAAFMVPGFFLVIMAFLWFRFFPGIIAGAGSQGSNNNSTKNKVSFFSLLKEKRFSAFIIGSRLYIMVFLGLFIGIVKEGLTLWAPVIFTELYSLKMEQMLSVMSLLPLVNLLFILIGGMLIRKYWKDVKYTILLFLFTGLAAVFLVWRIPDMAFTAVTVLFYVLMASISTGSNQMTAFLPVRFAERGLVSAAAGIIDSSIYLGAAVAGPLVGAAAEVLGWNGIFGGIFFVCIAAFFTASLLKGSVEEPIP